MSGKVLPPRPARTTAASTGTSPSTTSGPVTPHRLRGVERGLSDEEGSGSTRATRRYLKSVSGVHDVAGRAFSLRRGHVYLKSCIRRSGSCGTLVTCVYPLVAAASEVCLPGNLSSATCLRRKTSASPGLIQNGLKITADRRGRCAVQHDRMFRTELGFSHVRCALTRARSSPRRAV